MQRARVISRLEPVLREQRPRAFVVPGAVNSSMPAALATLQLAVVHFEAGLRSGTTLYAGTRPRRGSSVSDPSGCQIGPSRSGRAASAARS